MLEIYFWANGNTMAFEKGQQVPEAQESWLVLYLRYLESKGYDPVKVKLNLPDGMPARPFKIVEDGQSWYNWDIG